MIVFYILSFVGNVFLSFWYWHTYEYEWWTVPVIVSFASVWFLVFGLSGWINNRRAEKSALARAAEILNESKS